MEKYVKQLIFLDLVAQELSLMELKDTVSLVLFWVGSCSEKTSPGKYTVQSPKRLIPSSYFA